MIVNDDKEFIFIAIPKTASTSIHMAWGHVNHPPPPEYHMEVREAVTRFPDKQAYFKFCFVRNPFDRLVSTWSNLTDPKAGHTWASPLSGYDGFDSFCLDLPNSEFKDWIHFKPQSRFTTGHEGNSLMDFIGRFENLNNDFKKACEIIGVEPPVLKRYRHSSHHPYRQYYDEETKKIVERIYGEDLAAYGYEF